MTQLVELARHGHPTRQLDAFRLGDAAYLDELCGWAAAHLGTDPVVVRASAESAVVGAVQSRLGKERSGQLVENALGRIAQACRRAGARHIIVAGGESSGAVAQALQVRAMRIGAQIAPDVPWIFNAGGLGEPPLPLVLKSGNFGGRDFFSRALAMLPTPRTGVKP